MCALYETAEATGDHFRYRPARNRNFSPFDLGASQPCSCNPKHMFCIDFWVTLWAHCQRVTRYEQNCAAATVDKERQWAAAVTATVTATATLRLPTATADVTATATATVWSQDWRRWRRRQRRRPPNCATKSNSQTCIIHDVTECIKMC